MNVPDHGGLYPWPTVWMICKARPDFNRVALHEYQAVQGSTYCLGLVVIEKEPETKKLTKYATEQPRVGQLFDLVSIGNSGSETIEIGLKRYQEEIHQDSLQNDILAAPGWL